MDTKKDKKEKTEKDIEIPSLDDEIKNWCEVPTETDDSKSADDLVIDAWCQDSSVTEKVAEKTKKDKK